MGRLEDVFGGIVIGACLSVISCVCLEELHQKNYRTPQKGYVALENIKIYGANFDEDKGEETYFLDKKTGRNFVIIRDKDGNPVLRRYTTQPARIIPIEENEESSNDSDN